MIGWIFKLLPVVLGVTLVAAAALHRWTLGSPGYTQHWLIKVEFLLLAVLLILILIQGIYAVGLLLGGEWGTMLLMIGLVALSTILLFAALSIDAPTLLYMT